MLERAKGFWTHECVNALIDALGDRSGFDGFWDDIDPLTQKGIKNELRAILLSRAYRNDPNA